MTYLFKPTTCLFENYLYLSILEEYIVGLHMLGRCILVKLSPTVSTQTQHPFSSLERQQ